MRSKQSIVNNSENMLFAGGVYGVGVLNPNPELKTVFRGHFESEFKIEGIVSWFERDKGFGVIEANNTSYFAHWLDIKLDGEKTLLKGQKVRFRTRKSQRTGPEMQAIEIEVLA